MPTWLKVILIIVAMIAALLCDAGYLGYRWLQSHKVELETQAAHVRADATAFAQGKDVDDCVAETLERVDRCDGIICEAKTKLFLTICLEKTNVPRDTCATLPKRTEFMASATWALAECARRGRPNDQRCTRMITALQERCEGGLKRKPSRD